ncbi:hypothetical protein [Fischerella sp. JS2]|uniref:hypothetical protein n=1 Tax=Fischerella sp. JS2 TaxID=2597771 RepID=UPI0028E8745E|nr:hypothetical protein [Fischerella sp. JS2]
MSKYSIVLDKNEITHLGASLREIQPNLLKQDPQRGRTRIWFQGEEPYFDVFFELQDHQITWFQFTLRGKSLSWDSKIPGWQTGTTNELKVSDVSFYAASKTIENDIEIDWEFMNLVKSIIQTRDKEEIFEKVLLLFNY